MARYVNALLAILILPVSTALLALAAPAPAGSRASLLPCPPHADISARPLVWGKAPPCRNEPLPAADWRRAIEAEAGALLTPEQIAGYWRRAQSASPCLARFGRLSELLAGGPSAAQALAALWLNVLDERLSLRTALALETAPNLTHVSDLLEALEASCGTGDGSPGLLTAATALLEGSGITNAVCASMLYLRDQHTIMESTWSEAGVIERIAWQAPSDGSFPWEVMAIAPSPDGKLVILETGSVESGGPLHVLDLTSGELLDLNRSVGLALSEEPGSVELDEEQGWMVLGWHPDGRHLLVAAEAQSAAHWVDLDAGQARRLPLCPRGTVVAGRGTIAIRPDGGGFVFVVGQPGEEEQELRYYDLSSDTIMPLHRATSRPERLHYPRWSPDGSTIAYVSQRRSAQGATLYAVRLLDVELGTASTVMECAVPVSEPVWSPDSRHLLLSVAEAPAGEKFFPECESWAGTTWLLSVRPPGVASALAAVQGVRSASWSFSGRFLGLTCASGRVGLAYSAAPAAGWQLGSAENPSFTCSIVVP